MEAQTIEEMTQNISDLTRETSISTTVLLPLFDQELDQTITGKVHSIIMLFFTVY